MTTVMTEAAGLEAPFPWFGGKSRAARLVWERFGDVPNYVEPFFGSGAVLLRRPHAPQTETVNDIDGYVANFWRAVSHDPGAVAEYAVWPVNENDLHARHAWLAQFREDLRARLEGDPEWFDVKIAGWWVWGICCWIGSGFCAGKGPWVARDGRLVDDRVCSGAVTEGRPSGDQRVYRNLPCLGGGCGILRKRPQIKQGGVGVHGATPIYEWLISLHERLRRVRVCCGDWSRIMGPSPTVHVGLTGVFLDPPYSAAAGRSMTLYTHDDGDVAAAVRAWAIEHGDDPRLRIALCGYDGEHDMPEGWTCVAWKARGGYGNQRAENTNRHRERIWFSRHCLAVGGQGELF